MGDESDKGSWWKTLPGVLSALAAFITAVTALIVGLNQTGLIGGAGKATAPSAGSEAKPVVSGPTPMPEASASPPGPIDLEAAQGEAGRAASEPGPGGTAGAPHPPQASAQSLLVALQQAGIGNSVGDAVMADWLALPDRHYERMARACLQVLGARRLAGQGADLDKINAMYLRSRNRSVDDILSPGESVEPRALSAAIVAAYNDRNGGQAKTLAAILAPPGP